jgi:hypothetical protein
MLFLAAFMCGGALRAEFLEFNLWGGYTSVNVAKVNETFDMVRDQVKTDTSGLVDLSVTKMHDAWVAGLDANYALSPSLWVGPRVEWLTVVPGKLEGTGTNGATTLKLTATYEATLIPVLAGVTEKHALGDLVSLDTSFYLGAGFAGVHQTTELESNVANPASGKWEAKMGGTCFVGELSAALSFKLSPITAGLTLGWRVADVPEFNYLDDVTLMGDTHKKGDAVRDPNDRVMDLDYGGLIAGISIAYAF